MTSKIQFRGATSGFVELAAPDTAGSNTVILPSGTGASGDFISTDGNGNLSFAPSPSPTSLGDAATASGTDLQFNSGFGSVATAYGVRAWICFNGNNGTAIASGNVSSVTDNGTGDYTLNFTNAMPDTNYAIAGNSDGNAGGNGCNFGPPAVGSIRMIVFEQSGTLRDHDKVFAIVVR